MMFANFRRSLNRDNGGQMAITEFMPGDPAERNGNFRSTFLISKELFEYRLLGSQDHTHWKQTQL